MLFDLLGFLLLLPTGLANPRKLLYLFIWTMPFMAGNMIGPFFIPYTPWRSAIYCYLFCVFVKSGKFAHAKRFAASALGAFTFFTIFTAVGILYAQFYAPYLASYTQSPVVHGFRVLLSELIVWLLPVALLWHIQEDEEGPRLIRHILFAGVFYCGLGVLQFAVVTAEGYDLFPIVRGAQDTGSMTIQTVAGTSDEVGRINSICGEPRFLSLYCTVWFLLVLTCGNALRLEAKGKAAVAGLFLLTNILTISRSGLVTLGAGLLGLLFLPLFARQRDEARKVSKAVLLLPILIGAAFLFQGEVSAVFEDSVFAKRISDVNRSIDVLGLTVPLEYPDLATINLLSENPLGLISGFGAGLWQYYVDPFEDPALRRTYSNEETLDSLKQNIAIVARMTHFGLIGLVLVFFFYRHLYRHLYGAEASMATAPRAAGHFFFWIFLLQITVGGEAYIPIILVASARLAASVPDPLHGLRRGRPEQPSLGTVPA
jgi:hypothetical protein